MHKDGEDGGKSFNMHDNYKSFMKQLCSGRETQSIVVVWINFIFWNMLE